MIFLLNGASISIGTFSIGTFSATLTIGISGSRASAASFKGLHHCYSGTLAIKVVTAAVRCRAALIAIRAVVP